MHGDQIGQHHGANQPLMVAAQVLGILHNGQRAGDALVARSAHDSDRQRTTIHARVGTGGSTGAGTARHIVGTGA